ncbi:MAG: 4Fe-4S dicluster domain-containing protein [Desulfobacterales bacterium]
MQVGFYFDQTRCTGCNTCQVACKDWHDIPAGPEHRMRLKYIEKGTFPDVYVGHLIQPCYQCVDPVCAAACPVDAIKKRAEDGIVETDSAACLGNEACDEKCLKACPYDAPQFGPESGSKMRKCDYCLDRQLEDKMPICIESCPTRALDGGSLDGLEKKYGATREAEGFVYSKRTQPAITFRPKPSS